MDRPQPAICFSAPDCWNAYIVPALASRHPNVKLDTLSVSGGRDVAKYQLVTSRSYRCLRYRRYCRFNHTALPGDETDRGKSGGPCGPDLKARGTHDEQLTVIGALIRLHCRQPAGPRVFYRRPSVITGSAPSVAEKGLNSNRPSVLTSSSRYTYWLTVFAI